MNPNDPYYPDGNNAGISIREKLIFDYYIKHAYNYKENLEKLAKIAVSAADILLNELKKEEKQ